MEEEREDLEFLSASGSYDLEAAQDPAIANETAEKNEGSKGSLFAESRFSWLFAAPEPEEEEERPLLFVLCVFRVCINDRL